MPTTFLLFHIAQQQIEEARRVFEEQKDEDIPKIHVAVRVLPSNKADTNVADIIKNDDLRGEVAPATTKEQLLMNAVISRMIWYH